MYRYPLIFIIMYSICILPILQILFSIDLHGFFLLDLIIIFKLFLVPEHTIPIPG